MKGHRTKSPKQLRGKSTRESMGTPPIQDIMSVRGIKKPDSDGDVKDEEDFHNYSGRKLRQSVGKTMVELAKSGEKEREEASRRMLSMSTQSIQPILASTGQFQINTSSSLSNTNPLLNSSIQNKGRFIKSQEESQVEEEYITNLQKQINLLSTELELQKRVNNEMDRKMSEKTQVLEDPIISLKKKFAEKEEYNHQFEEKFKDELAEKQNQIFKMKEKYKKWKNKSIKEREQAKLEVRSLHEKYVPEVVKLEKQVDNLNLRLKQEKAENDKKNEEVKNFLKEVGEITKKLDTIQMQKEQAEKQVQPLCDELALVKKQLLTNTGDKDSELKEIESLKGRLSHYEKEWEDALHNLKKKDLETKQLQLDKELVAAERDKLKDQLKALNEKYNELDTATTKLQTKLNETQWDLTKTKQDYETLMKEKTTQEKEMERAKTEFKENKFKYDEMRRQYKEIQEKLQVTKLELDSFTVTRYNSLQTRNDKLEETLKELALKDEQLSIECKKLSEENQKLTTDNKYLEAEREQYEKNDVQRRILVRKLKHQLKLSLAVSQVDKQGLTTLMSSNLNVAQSIQTLMGIIKEGNDIEKDEKDLTGKLPEKEAKKNSTEQTRTFDAWISKQKR